MLPRIVPILACLLLLAGLPVQAQAQQAPQQHGTASPQEANGQTFRSDLEASRLLPQDRAAAARKRSQQTLALIAIAGSAAAVAADLAPIATASDTGGSIRQPAALCNLTGFKPTYGLLSRFGMIAFASSLDQAGTLSHSAEDAALLLNAMAGKDLRDSTSMDNVCGDLTAQLEQPLTGLKIGLPEEFFNPQLNGDIAALIEARPYYRKNM